MTIVGKVGATSIRYKSFQQLTPWDWIVALAHRLRSFRSETIRLNSRSREIRSTVDRTSEGKWKNTRRPRAAYRVSFEVIFVTKTYCFEITHTNWPTILRIFERSRFTSTEEHSHLFFLCSLSQGWPWFRGHIRERYIVLSHAQKLAFK